MVSISQIAEDDVIVLKAIHASRRATPEKLAKDLGEPYTAQDLALYLKELEQRKLVSKVQIQPAAYELTPIGMLAIDALPPGADEIYSPVSPDKCFYFFTGMGPDKFTQSWACNLAEFRDNVKTIDVKSLEFHVPRGDVQNWLRNVLSDTDLAREVDRVKQLNAKGESLRSALLRAVEFRIQRLSQRRP